MLDGYRKALEFAPLASSTRRMYVSQARRFLEWVGHIDAMPFDDDPNQAWTWAVREYRIHLKAEHKAPATINATLGALNDLGTRTLEMQPLKLHYEDLPQAAPRALDTATQRRLLHSLEGAKARDRVIVLLGLLEGLRVGEIAALNIDDISLSAKLGTIKVWHGKGNKSREVPLHSELRKALFIYLQGRKDGDALFIGRGEERLSTRAVGQIVIRAGKRAGIDNLTPHVLRHSCATNMIRAGVDIVQVADLLGHSSLDTTRRYSLPSAADRQKAIEAAMQIEG